MASSNQPDFDPLNPTPQEEADMLAGHRAAYGQGEAPRLPSQAWEHGYRMGRNDRAGVVDDDQRELARRFLSPPLSKDKGGLGDG